MLCHEAGNAIVNERFFAEFGGVSLAGVGVIIRSVFGSDLVIVYVVRPSEIYQKSKDRGLTCQRSYRSWQEVVRGGGRGRYQSLVVEYRCWNCNLSNSPGKSIGT